MSQKQVTEVYILFGELVKSVKEYKINRIE